MLYINDMALAMKGEVRCLRDSGFRNVRLVSITCNARSKFKIFFFGKWGAVQM